MDEKKTENVYNAVRILIKEQKVQSSKILELENKFDIIDQFNARLKKLEKDQNDNRFDIVIKRFDSFDTVTAQ